MTFIDTKIAFIEMKITEVNRITTLLIKLGQVVDLLVAKISGLT
jgi:hypothetical protein